MDTKIKEAKRAYYKKWRQSHPEKVKEYQDRYWTKKAAEMEESQNDQHKHK